MSTLVERARSFALVAHYNHTDKAGKPYFLHVETVAKWAVAYARQHPELFTENDCEVIEAAGYLHDTVEDTEVTLKGLRGIFGDEVAECVLSLTRLDPLYAHRLGFTVEKKETYREFCERTYRDLRARVVKREGDLKHNMSPERHSALPKAEQGIMHRYNKAMAFFSTGEWPKGGL